LFECPPQQTQLGQKFSQVPNPYVIEPPALGTLRLAPGELLVFHMVLVGEPSLRQMPLVVHAWQRALREGLGHARTPAKLLSVDWVPPNPQDQPVEIFHSELREEGNSRLQPHPASVELPEPERFIPHEWAHEPSAALELRLRFHTPLRLQDNGRALGPQDLRPRTLLSQLLRRTGLMLELHLDHTQTPYNASALLTGAQDVTDDRSQLRWQDWTRYSARQKQEMHLGGVIGDWTLRGTGLAPFLPWLHVARWLHLGKNATMGMGAFEWQVQTV
jgi:hypothetical protein